MRVGITTSIATAIAIGVLIASQGGGASTCPLPAYPSASCTGVPVGTVLTAYAGPNPVVADNTVIDSKNITSCLEINADNVTITKSKITVAGCGQGVVYLNDQNLTADLTITDSEIACTAGGVGTSGPGTAFSEARMTVRRADIYGCENGFNVNQTMTIEDSFIHDLYNEGADPHTDGIEFGTGHWNGSSFTCTGGCVRDVTISHNTILSMCPGATTPETDEGCYTTSAIISHSFGVDQNILIQNNLLGGGAFTLYCDIGFTGVNYHVDNNHFTTRYKATVGFFGPSSDCSDETTSGNVYDETGLPVTMD